jgi:hypothetical protein
VKLRNFIHIMVQRMLPPDSPSWHRQLLLRELADPTVACAEFVEDHVRPSAVLLGKILEELLPQVPSAKRQLVAFSIVGQCMFHRVAEPIVTHLVGEQNSRTSSGELLGAHIADFSLAALEPYLSGQES